MSRRPAQHGARQYPRTARLNELLRQILADELERLDDDRLQLVTVMAVDVDPDLRHATVHYATLDNADDVGADAADAADSFVVGAGSTVAHSSTKNEAQVRAALSDLRPRLQAAVARQARMKRTPELSFRPDTVELAAARVEAVLRDLHRDDETGRRRDDTA